MAWTTIGGEDTQTLLAGKTKFELYMHSHVVGMLVLHYESPVENSLPNILLFDFLHKKLSSDIFNNISFSKYFSTC